jgi:hypothetical protein
MLPGCGSSSSSGTFNCIPFSNWDKDGSRFAGRGVGSSSSCRSGGGGGVGVGKCYGC